ncbi:MAG TPA: phosphoribosylamine--glycine ligase [Blastocatellia bacterium]|nr:phosphoribosylamine--glycine ligase [Blastocatellia bacterium]
MKILVIGSGGREHALCWKLAQSPSITALYSAPGNAGIAEIATCIPADLSDPGSLANLAESVGADLTVIGPEAPLVAGVAEHFQIRGLKLIGPSQAAAQLEGSKIFAKQFMARHNIPTAQFTACHSPESARAARELEYRFPVVVKADGLAAGKGVSIARDGFEFDAAINQMMVDRAFGEAGARVVVEECLTGREASIMVFTDGRDYKVLPPAQDYKRAFDQDQGPNTGGMGSISTPGLIDAATLDRIESEIIEPTLRGMASEGNPFSGILYAGLMLTEDGPKVIEYNVRLGDPETEALMVRLDSDLVEIFSLLAEGRIREAEPAWSSDSSVTVVVASGGYPGEFDKGRVISNLDDAKSTEGVVIFHAGTMRDEQGSFLTSGGRVLAVTARAGSLDRARARAYEAVSKINFEKIHYRNDIGKGER